MGLQAEQRRRLRQSTARPLIDDLAAFLDASLATISGRNELAKAIRYALTRWTALTRNLDDGTMEISNNAAERAIRLGRKNSLFVAAKVAPRAGRFWLRFSTQRNSTVSIRKLSVATCSNGSSRVAPRTNSSRNCWSGTGRRPSMRPRSSCRR
jgi:hypothetical protein